MHGRPGAPLTRIFSRLATAVGWRLRCLGATRAARRASRAVLGGSHLRRLLVVCYGNIYRSPYVAGLLRARLRDLCEVRSSGFHRASGRPSPAELVVIAAAAGIDLSGHRSTTVTASDLAWADAIILMDRHNWQALQQCAADPGKLVWLGTFDGGCEIPDPYGRPESEVRDVMQRVHRCAEALAGEIRARRGSSAT